MTLHFTWFLLHAALSQYHVYETDYADVCSVGSFIFTAGHHCGNISRIIHSLVS